MIISISKPFGDNGVDQAIGKIPSVVSNIGDKIGSTISSIGWGLELIVLVPVTLIGLGFFYFLKNASGDTISNVSSNAAKVAPLALA